MWLGVAGPEVEHSRMPGFSFFSVLWEWVFDVICIVSVCTVTSATPADTSVTFDLLWPKPSAAQFGSDTYSLNKTFEFKGAGAGGDSKILAAAFDRYHGLIFNIPTPFYPSGNSSQSSGALGSVTVTVSSDDETLALQTDESCRLIYYDDARNQLHPGATH